MTGPSFAPILIPIVGTLSLVAWLIVVFRAGRDSAGPARTRRPALVPARPGRLTRARLALAGRIRPVRRALADSGARAPERSPALPAAARAGLPDNRR
jgi:hypothetical protein